MLWAVEFTDGKKKDDTAIRTKLKMNSFVISFVRF